MTTAAGPDRRDRAETIAGFAPRTAGGIDDDDLYDLLIATDVLSEGVNLQQARHIINYDLPWNPMRLVQRHGRIDRIGSDHREVFLRCFFPDEQLERLLGLEERLQRKLQQAAAATGVGEVLPGYGSREVNLTETREEIERLRREDTALFEDGGSAALSGEEYRRVLARDLANASMRQTVLGLPWGSGTGFVTEGARSGYVFCVRIGDHKRPWFRFVPLNDAAELEVDGDGLPVVIDDTLACLAAADPRSPDVTANLPAAIYETAFDAWRLAKEHIVRAWMFNADPANLQPVVPRVMRDAAELVRRSGGFLGEGQDDLIDRLQAPYSPRILRAVREVLAAASSDRERIRDLEQAATRLGLARQPAPEPLPAITAEDVYLVCWMAIVQDGSLRVPDPEPASIRQVTCS